MSGRVVSLPEIRDALAYYPDVGFIEDLSGSLAVIVAAAMAYRDLLETDPLVIRREEDGNWPQWAVAASTAHHRRPQHPNAMDALFDAQGSEVVDA